MAQPAYLKMTTPNSSMKNFLHLCLLFLGYVFLYMRTYYSLMCLFIQILYRESAQAEKAPDESKEEADDDGVIEGMWCFLGL
jgi:hypothetical protein